MNITSNFIRLCANISVWFLSIFVSSVSLIWSMPLFASTKDAHKTSEKNSCEVLYPKIEGIIDGSDEKTHVVFAINAIGEYRWNGKLVQKEKLNSKLRELKHQKPIKNIVIYQHPKSDCAPVHKVLRKLEKSGVCKNSNCFFGGLIDYWSYPSYIQPVRPPPPPLPPPPSVSFTGSPRPVGNPLAWVTEYDYPYLAFQNHWTGITSVLLLIAPNGTIISCEITQSSGHTILDEAACRNIVRRASFLPALKNGEPNKSFYHTRINWNTLYKKKIEEPPKATEQ
jgi:TonB family protein